MLIYLYGGFRYLRGGLNVHIFVGGFGCLNVCMGEKAAYGEWRMRSGHKDAGERVFLVGRPWNEPGVDLVN